MKKLIIIAVMLIAGSAWGQQYNPYQIQPYQAPVIQPYQVVQPPAQQPIQKYNPMNNTWQTTYPDSQLKYNPLANELAKQWEYVTPNAQPVYNPFSGEFEYPR